MKSIPASRFLVLLSALALMAGPLIAQEQPSTELKKTADGFAHEASNSKLAVPAGWEVVPPQVVGRSSFLGVRKPSDGIEVTFSWSSSGAVKFGDVVARELEILSTLYGREKIRRVPDTEAPMAGGKPGVKLLIDDGPNQNGKETGAVYLFAAGPDGKQWKVKVRATVPRMTTEDALKQVDQLVQKLQF